MSSVLWRLIQHDTADGAMQMAVDEAILEAHLRALVPPTLRLYRFSPPAVTIGLSQTISQQLVDSIASRGYDVVRRPTGGRAVLHLNDLTYCFVASDTSVSTGVLARNISVSYKQICNGLIAALGKLGIESQLGSAGTAYRHLKDCFMATTGSDLHHQGVKIIGSAQLRRGSAVLQHGSLPLIQEAQLMAEVLHEPPSLTRRHHNLFDLAGRAVPDSELQEAFRAGFAQVFNVEFVESTLSDWERQFAQQRLNHYRSLTTTSAVAGHA